MSLPLRGVRVLDLSRILAGPWCTMLLGDAGATVVKLERIGQGDDTRSWGPPFVGELENQISTYFLSVNRSKKSIAVDIKHKDGLDICRRLATEWADVIVENFKGGTMDRLGMDYESLSKVNPGLVYCSVSGFGSTGPFSERPGYDVIVSGMYGLMSITGDEHGDPAKVGVASTDVLTGTLAHSGILAALYERERTGRGKKVEVSLMETQLAGLVNIASKVLNAPEGAPEPRRWGTAHESIVPYQAFRCKSRGQDKTEYIMVGAGNDEQFVKFCRVLEISELVNDPRFQTNAERVANRSILIPLLEDRFKQESRDYWVHLLEDKGFALGPLRTVSEAFQCEQAIHRGVVEEMDHPVVGKIRLPRSPIHFSSPGVLADEKENHEYQDSIEKLPPPMLGEHTEEVLGNLLQMSAKDIANLENRGVVECWRYEPNTH
jgi:crotonobetainyl-CoA:carnitine CoA-transferase CaiB-like acyl-CoA transferase